MYQWRVTKYNPRFRNRQGVYQVEDWTCVSDIGKTFNGHRLELEEYLATEERYVLTAMHFLEESGLSSLEVRELEADQEVSPTVKHIGLDNLLLQGSELHEKQKLSKTEIARACRLNLRNLLWCKLEETGKFFIHFGYDYYMYVGSLLPCPDSISYSQEIGIFVETMSSPYN
ncbi:MAG: hypothetical protein F6K47_35635 [Symploca sp. SIO2E6]|nr:hypothetical protein [Symploca sp. SIO2E6]